MSGLARDMETIYQKGVTVFGIAAKIGCDKRYLGHVALVIIHVVDES